MGSDKLCKPVEACLEKKLICDGFYDCFDGEDEANCPCSPNLEYQCKTGKCLANQFLCDGIQDCLYGDDEEEDVCKNSQRFKCIASSGFWCEMSKSCLEVGKRCDGQIDCGHLDKSDELHCLHLKENDPPQMVYCGKKYRVCADDWEGLEDELCTRAGYGVSLAFEVGELDSNPDVTVDVTIENSTKSIVISIKTNCRQRLIKLSCQITECGVKQNPREISALAISGQIVEQSSIWPWHVKMESSYRDVKELSRVCGGSVINQSWIVTSAHCLVKFSKTEMKKAGELKTIIPDSVKVFIGQTDIANLDGVIIRHSRAIHVHPAFGSNSLNDIALIKLDKEITFGNRRTSSICLSKENKLYRYRLCVSTGTDSTSSRFLQHVRVAPVSQKQCQHFTGESSTMPELFCAISFNIGLSLGSACPWHSGGHLSCWDEGEQRWELTGIASHVRDQTGTVADKCQFGVFIHVDKYISWIESTMTID